MDDAELASAARSGSVSAFTAIFDRHATPVHQLALAMLRDRRAALEVVEATFREAGVRLRGMRDDDRLAVWLLAVARRQAALRAGLAAGPDRQPGRLDDDPERVRLAGLVWEAVAELPLLERTALELTLRHRLEGPDLTDALGVTSSQAQGLEDRIPMIDRELSSHLVARTGDGRCPELTRLLKRWDGRFGASDPRHVVSHVEACPACTRVAESQPPPLSLYVPASTALYPAAGRERALRHLVGTAAPAGAGPGTSPGQPERADPATLPLSARTPPPAGPLGPPSSPDPPSPAPMLVLRLLPEARREQNGRTEAPATGPTVDRDLQAQPPPSGSSGSIGAPPSDVPVVAAAPPPPPDPDVAPSSRPGAAGGRTADSGQPPHVGDPPWKPDGFPPPSFARDDRTSPAPAPGRRRRGRWVTAALLGAVLLLGGALLLSGRDDRTTALRFDATVTSGPVQTTTPPEPATVPAGGAPLVPPGSVVPVPESAGTAPSAAPTSASPQPAAGSGELFATVDSVRLPTVSSDAGPQRGTLSLRNRGGSPIGYATRSSNAALTVDKPTGTIATGATTELTIILDGAKAAEGEFTGTLAFADADGRSGTQQVTVAATVGRPPTLRDDAGESCTTDVTPCSRLLQLVPVASPSTLNNPCNTPWRYSVTVEDESQLRAVRVDADLAGRDAELKKDGASGGREGRWQSDVFPPIPVAAALNITIEAVDQFGFFRFRTERTIQC